MKTCSGKHQSLSPHSSTSLNMPPPYSLAAWTVGLWYLLPYSVQVPIAIIAGVGVLAGWRTLDSWIRGLRKDPIKLGCQGLAWGCLAFIGIQLIYYTVMYTATPISEAVTSFYEAANASSRLAVPTSISTPIIVTTFIVSHLLHWWLSKILS